MRVLGSDEICHIFPEDDANDGNDDFEIDDIVSAIWLPNGKFYDAKILQKGGMFAHCMCVCYEGGQTQIFKFNHRRVYSHILAKVCAVAMAMGLVKKKA